MDLYAFAPRSSLPLPVATAVLPTRRTRAAFMPVVMRCWSAQTRKDVRLVVVADEWTPTVPGAEVITVPAGTSLGAKLNAGIAASRTPYICKIDDDDYYGPSYAAQMLNALAGGIGVAFASPYLILDVHTMRVHRTPRDWVAGGTLVFPRVAWQECPFPDVPRRVDAAFLAAHAFLPRVAVDVDTAFVHVYHAGATWTHVHGIPLARLIATMPVVGSADRVLPAWACEVYDAYRRAEGGTTHGRHGTTGAH